VKRIAERAVYGAKRLLRRALRARARATPAAGPRALVLMDAGMGNAVEATPLVQALRTLWPRAHLTIAPPEGDLFDDWNVVDRIARERAALEGEEFDHLFVAWSAAPPGPGLRAGTVHRAEGLFRLHPLVHERESNLRLARRLGYEGPTPPPYVSLRAPALPLPHRFVAVAPGGNAGHRWRNKRWMRWGGFIAALLERAPGLHVAIVGLPEDRIDPPPPESPRLLDLRGRLTPRETAFVLKRALAAVGNDCGPMHVADAAMIPTVWLFGPTCEIKNGPRHRGRVLRAGVPCSPCQFDFALLDSCPDPVCMKGIGVAETVEALLAAMPQSAHS
jgi:ADP-heptose:LPS heptosyltransferase